MPHPRSLVSPEIRPVAFKDEDLVVVACGDTGVQKIELDLKNHTQLWVKNERYSLFEIFDGDAEARGPP